MACHNPIKVKNKACNIVPCGKCPACLVSRSQQWAIRLKSELKNCENGYFVTLTYDDTHVPRDNGQLVLRKKDLQNLFKRYRRKYENKFAFKSNLLYYAVGEYGERTYRPHYHLILFNVEMDLFLEEWKKGFSHVGDVEKSSINYCTSYVINKQNYSKRLKNPPFAIMSKGLGKAHLTKEMINYHKKKFSGYIVAASGEVHTMPRYIKLKIWNCETAIKLLGMKNKIYAQKELKNQKYEHVIGKRRYQRVLNKRSKNSSKNL